MRIDDRAEWLEADGLGGFASGTTTGVRTRRYHALLLSATTPPTGRVVLVNGVEVWVETAAGPVALSSQRYVPGVVYPDGASRIRNFEHEPWPTWEYELPDGARLTHEVVLRHGVGTAAMIWTFVDGTGPVVLRVRPLLSGRDYHSLHHENGAFAFAADQHGPAVVFRSYPGVPDVAALSNGEYRHAPDWYRRFLYSAETERGLDDTEDLAVPGEFAWRLERPGDEAILLFDARGIQADLCSTGADARALGHEIRERERERRASLGSSLGLAADAYLVRRNTGRTIVAGYPWFTDWGRDTFIAVRGLCLATGRLALARDILVEWAGAVSAGMLPNRFPDRGEAPEFNSVDAALWYVIAASELLQATETTDLLSDDQRRSLVAAIVAIVRGYAAGTRYGIRMDHDALLAAGVPGSQLTWMDARVGDRTITPRVGKPVEVQALWINALAVAARHEPEWQRAFETALESFQRRFWNEDTGMLSDVVDVDHRPGTRDDACRPNQVLAVGGLPLAVIDMARGRRIVDAVEAKLLTPLGLRSLAPGEPGYAPHYAGGPGERDAIYHQGTVWPWLIGPFVEAWLRVRGGSAAARAEARQRFLEPLMRHRREFGLGHVSEIADAEAPFTARGCPFQAWSLAELLRVERLVLDSTHTDRNAPASAAS